MQIGIGTPLPLIGNLPSQGQGGGGITFTYVDQDYCSNASDPSPTVVPAGGTFSELNGNSGLVINATTGVIDISASTSNASYTAKYTDPGGKSANFPINISTYPAVTITGNSSVCEGTATTLTVASGYSYQWYKDSVLISGATSNTYNPDVNTIGSSVYYVIATNTFSGITCTDQSANFSFAVNEVPVASISASSTTICTGDSVTLTANPTPSIGNYTYQWTSPSSTSRSITVSPSSNTTYEVVITNSDTGCVSASVSQAITVSSAPTVIDNIDNDYTMSFNGTDEYVSANYNSIFNQSVYSFSLWIKNTQNNINSDKGVLCADASGSRGFALQQNGQKLKWDSNISGGSSQLLDADFFDTTATWMHCVVTYDGSNLKMYKNGQLQETISSGTSNMNPNSNNLTIGNNPFAAGRFFSGDIDEVAIWNSSLSSCDVAGIYDATTSVNGQPKSANLLDANTTIPAPVYWNRMGD